MPTPNVLSPAYIHMYTTVSCVTPIGMARAAATDAAIRINYAQNVSVSSCNFLASIGGNGIAIGNSTTDSSVVGSLFDHVDKAARSHGFDCRGTCALAPWRE